jgi:predicted nucleic acid-binding protein
LRAVLGAGEREVIALAAELSAVILMDDRDTRREAEKMNLAAE